MYSDLPFLVSIVFIALGLWVLVWSANRFVDASGALATNLGVPSFIIGMVVIGFGTSAPELAVSAISAAFGHSEIALGNAWGSNILSLSIALFAYKRGAIRSQSTIGKLKGALWVASFLVYLAILIYQESA